MRGVHLDGGARSDLIKGSSDVGSVSPLAASQLFQMKYFCQSPDGSTLIWKYFFQFVSWCLSLMLPTINQEGGISELEV